MGGKNKKNKRKTESDDADYSSKNYWDTRYKTGDAAGHVWYFDFAVLKPLLTEVLVPAAGDTKWELLEIGGGDRPLLPAIVEDPFFQNTYVAICIDYSPAVTRMMRIEERKRRLGAAGLVAFECADARNLQYKNDSFHIVIDKGTIDAMMCSNDIGHDNANLICAEAARVVRIGGYFLVISHMSPTSENGNSFLRQSLIPALLDQAKDFSWDIGVHFDESAEESGPFVYAIYKALRRKTRSVTRNEINSNIPVHLHMY